jgi:hypothetical protein
MTQLGRLLRLSAADQRLLVTAALLQVAIRLGLVVLPYRRLRGLVDRLARVSPRHRLAHPSPERIAWAVTQASRAVPGAACLTQALAARVLLERRGHAAQVRVGVMRAAGSGLLAHAWVESEGHIVLGGTDLGRYIPLSEPPHPALSPKGRGRLW